MPTVITTQTAELSVTDKQAILSCTQSIALKAINTETSDSAVIRNQEAELIYLVNEMVAAAYKLGAEE